MVEKGITKVEISINSSGVLTCFLFSILLIPLLINSKLNFNLTLIYLTIL